MKSRSSDNWKTKSGGWDVLNTALVDFDEDYPVLSSFLNYPIDFQTVMCNNYKAIDSQSLISMFVDDYILERYWNNPKKYINYFKDAQYVMSPDFSLLLGMPKPMLQWNTYRNRLVGYIWQQSGLKVIPTISWTDESSFDFCFNGVEKGSVVAISNTGCRNEWHKKYFDKGFEQMIKTLEPKKVLFQCNAKYRSHYVSDDIIFLESFWDVKRKQLKRERWEVEVGSR
jgi:Domain of unknown function (DUF4417)